MRFLAAIHRRRGLIVGICFACSLYLGIYAVLSALGQYRWRPSGERRWSETGLAVFDLRVWRPAGIDWERRRSLNGEYFIDADPLGWVFLPLLSLDRSLIHPTQTAFDREKNADR